MNFIGKSFRSLSFRSFSTATVLSKASDKRWRIISGFGTFSCKRDVEKLFRENNIAFSALDAVLSKHHYLNGKWAVLFDKLEDIGVMETKLHNSPFKKLEPINEAYAQVTYASDRNIDNRTIRMKDIHRDIQIPELLYFLEDYNVGVEDVEFGFINSKFCHYFIKFQSSELAQRCIMEKNLSYLNDRPVHMVWYDV